MATKLYTQSYRGGGHEQLISNGGRFKPAFAEREKCKPVLRGLSLAENLVKPLLSLYGTEWRERGYGLRQCSPELKGRDDIPLLLEDKSSFKLILIESTSPIVGLTKISLKKSTRRVCIPDTSQAVTSVIILQCMVPETSLC